MLDSTAIRHDFPVFRFMRDRQQPFVYLDNAATTQRPEAMLNALNRFYIQTNANVHRGTYRLSEQATAAFEDVREQMAGFLGAASPDEIIFTHGTTESLNMVAWCWAWSEACAKGDIVLSPMEHHSNLIPWQFVAQRQHLNLRFLPLGADGGIDLQQARAMIGPETGLVSLVHRSNITGITNPVREIADAARAAGVPVCVDAAQSVPHEPVNVQELGVDFLAFSAHKMLGPTGTGVLYMRQEMQEKLPPFMGGGEMIHAVKPQTATWAEPPHKFEAGTPPVAGAVAMGAALRYIQDIGFDVLREHVHSLHSLLQEQCRPIDRVEWLRPPCGAGGIAAFNVRGVHPHDVAQVCSDRGVAIRAGHMCAQPYVQQLGYEALCRASLYIYNDEHDIEQLADALRAAVELFAP